MGSVSEKQRVFIGNLVAERDPSTFSAQTAAYLAALDDLTGRDPSKLIDLLLATPRKPLAESEKAKPGFYEGADGEAYHVVENKAGTSTYAKVLVQTGNRARWEYAPGKGKTLAGLTPMTVEQAGARGLAIGSCIVCCRTLTDPVSVANGIGPVCAKRF